MSVELLSRQISPDEAVIMEKETGRVVLKLKLFRSASLTDNEKLIKEIKRAYTKYTLNTMFNFNKDNR